VRVYCLNHDSLDLRICRIAERDAEETDNRGFDREEA